MTRKKGILKVDAEITLFKQGSNIGIQEKLLGTSNTVSSKAEGRNLDSVMEIIIQQLKVSGYRDRTIIDYIRYMNLFRKITNVEYLEEITSDKIYLWLDSMNVSNQTKLTRLKCLKATGQMFQ